MAFTPLLFEGFETGGFERFSTAAANMTISSLVRSSANGSNCVEIDGSGINTLSIYEFQNSANNNAKGFGFWFNPIESSTGYSIAQIYSDSGLKYSVVWSGFFGKFSIKDSTAATIIDDSTADKRSGWQFVEFWFEEGETANCELFVDGTSRGSSAVGDGTANSTTKLNFTSTGSGPIHYIDDIYFGEATASSDLPHGMDIFSTTGDGSATTGGDTLDAGSWANVQEIPPNDSNLASYNAGAGGNTDEREAPTSLITQTNLTGAYTDIDDDPDSPDGNWLTASGSSTLLAAMANPTGSPTVGAGLQNFRVLLRKNATGPASGSQTEDVIPDAITTQTGLTGAITDIDDDPDAPDGDTNWTGGNGWLTTNADNSVLLVTTTNPTNGANIDTALDAQTIKVFLRKEATGGGDPTFTLEVHDSGGLHETLATDIAVTTAGTLFTYNWTAVALSSPDDVQIKLIGTKGGGGPNARNLEVDAVRWEMVYTGAETQPGYEVRLYENGSVVSAVTAATGNLTDAGGDTIVQLAWDATELATADGSLVECYVNQTSGADRYIEIGAVEWNCKYPTPIPAESGWIEADSGAGEGPLNYEPRKIYYFDESDDAATGTNWSQPDRGFDGLITAYAWCDNPNTDELSAGGTTAPASGGTISLVESRFHVYGAATENAINWEIFTDGKGESLGSGQEQEGANTWSPYTALSTPTGGWTWAKLQALEIYLDRDIGATGTVYLYKVEIKVTASPVTALNEIIGLTTYARTKYSGSGSNLIHYMYHGNDVDGVTQRSLSFATAAWSDNFRVDDSSSIVPLITEHTRVGFGHLTGIDVDIDCAEIIGMVAHVPSLAPTSTIKQVNPVLYANIKLVNNVAIASVKNINGVA